MEDKKTVITIDIPSSDHLDFALKFYQSKPHCVWLDWGDGSQKDSFSEEGLIETSHTYPSEGEYEISMFAVDDGYIELVMVGGEYGYHSMITSLVVGDDVTAIKYNTFSNCENLETLEFLGGYIELGEYAFTGCVSLTDVALPKDISIIPDGLFFGCSGLKSVQLPENLGVISTNAFYGCSRLKEINLSNVTIIGNYAFQGCRKLTSLEFTDTLNEIGDGAFDSCSSIRTLALGKVTKIGHTAFCNCRSLSRVTVPETIRSIGESAFENCSFLKTIKMEASKPPILEGAHAFAGIEDFIIEVPRGSKRDYAYATNWSAYFDNIKEG